MAEQEKADEGGAHPEVGDVMLALNSQVVVPEPQASTPRVAELQLPLTSRIDELEPRTLALWLAELQLALASQDAGPGIQALNLQVCVPELLVLCLQVVVLHGRRGWLRGEGLAVNMV